MVPACCTHNSVVEELFLPPSLCNSLLIVLNKVAQGRPFHLDSRKKRLCRSDCLGSYIFALRMAQLSTNRTGKNASSSFAFSEGARPNQFAHPRVICTAFSHWSNLACASSGLMIGLNSVEPCVLTSLSSSMLFQTPTASPAAIAAPRAVVSRIAGRMTGVEIRSD